MGFFDQEDDFGIGDLFNQLVGNGFTEYTTTDSDGRKRTVRKSHSNLRRIPGKQVITKKNIFLIFDFSGEESVNVKIKDELVDKYGEKMSTGKKLIEIHKKTGEIVGEYILPDKLKSAGMEYTFNNGILEIKFKR